MLPFITRAEPTKEFAETQVPFVIFSLTVQRLYEFLPRVLWIQNLLTNIRVDNPLTFQRGVTGTARIQ